MYDDVETKSSFGLSDVLFIVLAIGLFVWIWFVVFGKSDVKPFTEDDVYQSYTDAYIATYNERPVAYPNVSLAQPIDVKKIESVGFTETELHEATRTINRPYKTRLKEDFDAGGLPKPPTLQNATHYYVEVNGVVRYYDADQMAHAKRLLHLHGVSTK